VSDPLVVVIAAADLLGAVRSRVDAVEVVGFVDADVLRALEAISTRRPPRVVLERAFATTSRGTALINRLKADPALRHTVIDVITHDSEIVRIPPARDPEPAGPRSPAEPVVPPPALDARGTRCAPRTRIADGVDIVVDGSSVRLMDLSVLGAQVLSVGVMKPNQRVRVSLVDESGSIRFAALVAWARFELPRGAQQAPQYRAGLDFLDADANTVNAFAVRHERQG
jgi:hypothetical protein